MRPSFWQHLLCGLFAVAFLCAMLLLLFSSGDKASIVAVVGILAGALMLAVVLPQLVEFSIGPKGVWAKLRELETEVQKAKENIAELFALSMSPDAYGHLTKLHNDGWTGHYYLDPELKVGLAVELNYLKSLGYIRFDKVEAVKGVEDLPKGNQDNLSQFISVTQAGKRFATLRQQTAEQTAK